jgi:hypothetical protein
VKKRLVHIHCFDDKNFRDSWVKQLGRKISYFSREPILLTLYIYTPEYTYRIQLVQYDLTKTQRFVLFYFLDIQRTVSLNYRTNSKQNLQSHKLFFLTLNHNRCAAIPKEDYLLLVTRGRNTSTLNHQHFGGLGLSLNLSHHENQLETILGNDFQLYNETHHGKY